MSDCWRCNIGECFTVDVTFGELRTVEGADIADLLRDGMPDADITALLDDAGALDGYRLTLHWPTADQAAGAALDIGHYLATNGYEFEVGAPDA